jgi:hypothetical protein
VVLERACGRGNGPFIGRRCLPIERENCERCPVPHGSTPHLLEATIMARQQAAQRPVEQNPKGSAGVQQQQQTSALIRFDPHLAVRAIVFHLVAEGITQQVAGDSIQATVVRLQRASIAPAVEQWMWAEMSHALRLQWLMEQTHTAARLVSEELSVLEPARG